MKKIILGIMLMLTAGAVSAGEFVLRNNAGVILVTKVPSQYLPDGWSSYQKQIPLGDIEVIKLPNHFTVTVQPVAPGYPDHKFIVPNDVRVDTHYWGSIFDLQHADSSRGI